MSATITKYRYRLTVTGESSAKYGPCEICRRHASEVFYQVREKAFRLDKHDPPTLWKMHPDGIGWSHDGDLFGHESCLIGARREEGPQL